MILVKCLNDGYNYFQDFLVPHIEGEGAKLCLHSRDFQVKVLNVIDGESL